MAVSEDRQPLIATLKKAAFHLKDADIPFCLAGSFAVYARGGESVDHDIDFLIKEEDAERVLAALGEIGFRGQVPPEGWLVKAWDKVPEDAAAHTDADELLIDFIFRPVQR